MSAFERLRKLMAATWDVAPETITSETAQPDLPCWDSLGHINLMLALEEEFGLSLEVDDMLEMTSVPAILDHLARHDHG